MFFYKKVAIFSLPSPASVMPSLETLPSVTHAWVESFKSCFSWVCFCFSHLWASLLGPPAHLLLIRVLPGRFIWIAWPSSNLVPTIITMFRVITTMDLIHNADLSCRIGSVHYTRFHTQIQLPELKVSGGRGSSKVWYKTSANYDTGNT